MTFLEILLYLIVAVRSSRGSSLADLSAFYSSASEPHEKYSSSMNAECLACIAMAHAIPKLQVLGGK